MSTETYFTSMIGAIEEARVPDFARYVNRRLRNEPELETRLFREGWEIMLGGYAIMAATNATSEEAEVEL